MIYLRFYLKEYGMRILSHTKKKGYPTTKMEGIRVMKIWQIAG